MKLSFFKVHGIDISIERFAKKGKGDPRSSAKDMRKIVLLAGYKFITVNESFTSMNVPFVNIYSKVVMKERVNYQAKDL